MSFLVIQVRHPERGTALDPDRCVDTMSSVFGQMIRVTPGDQFALALERARTRLKDAPPTDPVIRTLERNMRTQGPARSFEISVDGKEVGGVVKRPLLQLTWKGLLDNSVLDRIVDVVLSVSPPRDELTIELEQIP
jgi:hypothetical protein